MRVFLSAGDYSGDIHCSGLIEAMRKHDPSLTVEGIAGANCARAGMKIIVHQEELSALGFLEAALKYFSIRRIFNDKVAPLARAQKYDFCILCDFFGFNIHAARLFSERKVPVYYFISPQIWASRFSRIEKLKKYIDRMFVIFPFEEKIYKDNGIAVKFIGYPRLSLFSEKRKSPKQKIITLLPGSRSAQIARHLPVMLSAVRESGLSPEYRFYIIKSGNNPDTVYGSIPDFISGLVSDEDYSLRVSALASICSSGTATLENALLSVPTVIIFRTSGLTYRIAKCAVKVKYIGMPNILLGKQLFPELVQGDFTSANTARALSGLIGKGPEMSKDFERLAEMLDKGNAYDNFAGEIFKNA